jgi:hypothetical protein
MNATAQAGRPWATQRIGQVYLTKQLEKEPMAIAAHDHREQEAAHDPRI